MVCSRGTREDLDLDPSPNLDLATLEAGALLVFWASPKGSRYHLKVSALDPPANKCKQSAPGSATVSYLGQDEMQGLVLSYLRIIASRWVSSG